MVPVPAADRAAGRGVGVKICGYDAMYVVRERRRGSWYHGDNRLIFWLVESKRQDGRVCTHKLAYLGTIRERAAAARRSWTLWPPSDPRYVLWRQALQVLNDQRDRDRLIRQLARWVPLPLSYGGQR